MKNLKVKKFQSKVTELIEEAKSSAKKTYDEYLTQLKEIELISFTNANPYTGETKNKIFFTYNDHYKANSGLWMDVCKLNHPHLAPEDRGYIKGVATDLTGYLVLRKAARFNSNIEILTEVYMPKFKNSKNKSSCKEQCNEIVNKAIVEVSCYVQELRDKMNEYLKEKTGCALLYYVKNI